MSRKLRIAAALAAVGLASSFTANAQLFRAYLSTKGNDANPCTLPAPCRLLPAALAAVAETGEIWMLDSANYNTGPVTIDKSVTILAVPGSVGSVVSKEGNAIEVHGGASVTLRNLAIGPVAGFASAHGLVTYDTAGVSLEKSVVAGLGGTGVLAGGTSTVAILDSSIRDNALGVEVVGGANALLSKVVVAGHASHGLHVYGDFGNTAVAVVVDSVFEDNLNGVTATGAAGRMTKVAVTRSTATGNQANGFYARTLDNQAPLAIFELSNSIATRNAVGLANSQATFQSAGNNRSSGNTTSATSGTITITASR